MGGVYVRDRKPTKADFIKSAWDLRIYTLKTCTRFPQRYKRWITDYIVYFSAQAHVHCNTANMIFPKNKKEASEREELLKKALKDLDNMYPQIELAYSMFEMDGRAGKKTNAQIIKEWLPLIDKTASQIHALIKSDRKRFSKLPE